MTKTKSNIIEESNIFEQRRIDSYKRAFPQKTFCPPSLVRRSQLYGDATDSITILDKGSQLIYASSSKSSFEAIDSFLKDIGEDM